MIENKVVMSIKQDGSGIHLSRANNSVYGICSIIDIQKKILIFPAVPFIF